MYDAYDRIYNLFYMSLAAFGVVAGVGAIMAYSYSMDAPVDFSVSKVNWFGYSNRHFEESSLSFDIDADLAKLVHVNIRHFYAYIAAEWSFGEKDDHKIILWNQLVTRANPVVHVRDLPGNFTLRQVGLSVKGRNISLNFRIQMVPFIGFFRTKTLLSKNYTMPTKYFDNTAHGQSEN